MVSFMVHGSFSVRRTSGQFFVQRSLTVRTSFGHRLHMIIRIVYVYATGTVNPSFYIEYIKNWKWKSIANKFISRGISYLVRIYTKSCIYVMNDWVIDGQ